MLLLLLESFVLWDLESVIVRILEAYLRPVPDFLAPGSPKSSFLCLEVCKKALRAVELSTLYRFIGFERKLQYELFSKETTLTTREARLQAMPLLSGAC